MATSPQGTKVSIPAGQVPDDFTAPAVTTFTDSEYSRTFNLTVDKTTVQNADQATTLLAIIENATVGIEKQIDDIMAADFDDAALTVTYYIDLVKLSTNQTPETPSSGFLTNASVDYEARVNVYIKTA